MFYYLTRCDSYTPVNEAYRNEYGKQSVHIQRMVRQCAGWPVPEGSTMAYERSELAHLRGNLLVLKH